LKNACASAARLSHPGSQIGHRQGHDDAFDSRSRVQGQKARPANSAVQPAEHEATQNSGAVPTAQSHACKPTASEKRKRKAKTTTTCVSCRRIEMSPAIGSDAPPKLAELRLVRLVGDNSFEILFLKNECRCRWHGTGKAPRAVLPRTTRSRDGPGQPASPATSLDQY
jgi:hypothetical protein